MQVNINSCLMLMQSLLASIQNLPDQATYYDQMQALKQAKKAVAERLPVMITSTRQQKALDILKLEACLELFCKRRIEKIKDASLPEARKQQLIQDLSNRYKDSCQQLQAQWPALEDTEAGLLPLLLLRQSLETEIEIRIERLNKQNQRTPEGFWRVA